MSFEEFGFGENDENIGNDAPRKFKVEENKEYILSFAWWSEGDDGKPDFSGSPRFVGAERIFVDNVGAVIYQGPEYQKYSSGGDSPRKYVGTVVVQWPLTSDGSPDIEKIKARKWQVIPFVMSEGKYDEIRSLHKRFSMGENDLHIKCPKGGTQYQQMKFSPNPGSTFAKLTKTDKVWATLKAQIASCIPKVKAEIGREMTIAQIRDKLGEDGGQPVDLSGEEINMDEMIDDIIDD